MELKSLKNFVSQSSPETFNRTRMELKYSRATQVVYLYTSFNRTRMESKFVVEFNGRAISVPLLIAPEWSTAAETKK